jgi:hypothetical protein
MGIAAPNEKYAESTVPFPVTPGLYIAIFKGRNGEEKRIVPVL